MDHERSPAEISCLGAPCAPPRAAGCAFRGFGNVEDDVQLGVCSRELRLPRGSPSRVAGVLALLGPDFAA
eukprot:3396081-Pyramimonas_sp.AAC.1